MWSPMGEKAWGVAEGWIILSQLPSREGLSGSQGAHQGWRERLHLGARSGGPWEPG